MRLRHQGKFTTTRNWIKQRAIIFGVMGLTAFPMSLGFIPEQQQELQKVLVPYTITVRYAYAAEPIHREIEGLDCIECMIHEEFGELAEKAIKIAKCESGMRPEAVGDHKIAYMVNGKEYGKSWGIFQVRHLPGRPNPEQLKDAEFNIKYAKKVYDSQGWNAWLNCRRKMGV